MLEQMSGLENFYDTLQKALTTPNSVTETEFIGYLFTFAKIAALWIQLLYLLDFHKSLGFQMENFNGRLLS